MTAKVRASQCVRGSLLLIILSICITGNQDHEFARVTAVYDGDTIRVRLANGEIEKVRLIGIDSPELDDPREHIRLLACLSKRYTYLHLFGREVELIYDWERRDRYGRLLAFVRTPDGLFNRIILEQGFSSIFLKFPFKEDFRAAMIRADRDARQNRRGLWLPLPYPDVEPEFTREHLGRLRRVRFRCDSVRVYSRLIILSSPDKDFSAVVYRENLSRFPDLKRLQGKLIMVSGLIEEYRGIPQIIIFSPQQMETESDKLISPFKFDSFSQES